ncbi:hypothetical protein AVEN_11028-1 [Araneus ventricosus]|uniref:Uncharacterized protein n=1 Tax=Araneus ventricosus TaxID=182803 RepID=A0A4Y2PHG2_ARAVE|nr:hypothetical protein AVEN_269224-1 [Araneus ventricosus]GBN50651.1 hypothetical protein AVEN_11028-1 [Araneus ventricosus]
MKSSPGSTEKVQGGKRPQKRDLLSRRPFGSLFINDLLQHPPLLSPTLRSVGTPTPRGHLTVPKAPLATPPRALFFLESKIRIDRAAIFNVLDKVYVRTDVTDEGSYFSRGKESNLIRTVGVTLERSTSKKSCRRMLYMLSLDLLERVDSLTL